VGGVCCSSSSSSLFITVVHSLTHIICRCRVVSIHCCGGLLKVMCLCTPDSLRVYLEAKGPEAFQTLCECCVPFV
jgi:hypothetical protein